MDFEPTLKSNQCGGFRRIRRIFVCAMNVINRTKTVSILILNIITLLGSTICNLLYSTLIFFYFFFNIALSVVFRVVTILDCVPTPLEIYNIQSYLISNLYNYNYRRGISPDVPFHIVNFLLFFFFFIRYHTAFYRRVIYLTVNIIYTDIVIATGNYII